MGVMENKCKTISLPHCSVDWEKRCTSDPVCTTIQKKVCDDVEKDVCVDHMDKVCTMTSVKVCRKVAIQEEVEDWPTKVEDWPTTKGEEVHVKNAVLDKIEDITDAKIDHIEAKALKVAQKGEVDGPHKVQKRAIWAQKEHFKNAGLDKIEDVIDAKVDHISAKVMAKMAKINSKLGRSRRHTEAHAEKKAAIKAAKAKFKPSPFGHKAHKGKQVAPALKVRFVKNCEDEPRQTCKKLPRKMCHKETVPVCTHEPRESCVEKETCKSWPKKNCEMVP